ncbi:MAG: polysaccharide biosynthesis/export family protein [Hyphomicrobiaceae bacterium]|jgi:polysaccharide export outer membrane protein
MLGIARILNWGAPAMGWGKWVIVAALAVGLGACDHTRYPPESYGFDTDKSYTLDSGDQIRVVVYEADNLPQNFSVDAGGHISMPMAGVVSVRGKTVQQVEYAIASRLRDKFIKDPKVSVQMIAYRPFFILGEVKTAGKYDYVNGLTVEAAVAMAGGYTERASLAEARVVRPSPAGGNIVSYVPGGFPIRPGDTIYVPERWF